LLRDPAPQAVELLGPAPGEDRHLPPAARGGVRRRPRRARGGDPHHCPPRGCPPLRDRRGQARRTRAELVVLESYEGGVEEVRDRLTPKDRCHEPGLAREED